MSNVTINGLPVTSSIDPVNDLLPIFTNSSTSTQAISRNNLLQLASAPVGLTDTQTLTNKTITSPTISGPTLSGTLGGTYTIGGTPTFPSSVVQLTSTQTLTNKTLTSPTINAPTITNASLTADAISGFTTAGSGTIYGLAIAGGAFTTAGIIGSTGLQTNAVQASQLATNAITLGYTQVTANVTTTSTTVVQATGLTVTVTIPSGSRKIKITAYSVSFVTTAGQPVMSIWRGTVGSGTQIQQANGPGITSGQALTCIGVDTPGAGSVTYNIGFYTGSAGTATINAGTTFPAYILVEAI